MFAPDDRDRDPSAANASARPKGLPLLPSTSTQLTTAPMLAAAPPKSPGAPPTMCYSPPRATLCQRLYRLFFLLCVRSRRDTLARPCGAAARRAGHAELVRHTPEAIPVAIGHRRRVARAPRGRASTSECARIAQKGRESVISPSARAAWVWRGGLAPLGLTSCDMKFAFLSKTGS